MHTYRSIYIYTQHECKPTPIPILLPAMWCCTITHMQTHLHMRHTHTHTHTHIPTQEHTHPRTSKGQPNSTDLSVNFSLTHTHTHTHTRTPARSSQGVPTLAQISNPAHFWAWLEHLLLPQTRLIGLTQDCSKTVANQRSCSLQPTPGAFKDAFYQVCV